MAEVSNCTAIGVWPTSADGGPDDLMTVQVLKHPVLAMTSANRKIRNA
jgi:hypothetical protein